MTLFTASTEISEDMVSYCWGQSLYLYERYMTIYWYN